MDTATCVVASLQESLPVSCRSNPCANCFYWVDSIGCCRHGSENFQRGVQLSECDTYKPLASGASNES